MLHPVSNHCDINWAASSKFVSSSIPSWQILTAHAQPFRGTRDLAFCLKVPLDSLLVWVSSGGSGETAQMRRLAWTFAARIGDKYQIRLTRPNWFRDHYSDWMYSADLTTTSLYSFPLKAQSAWHCLSKVPLFWEQQPNIIMLYWPTMTFNPTWTIYN